jgi:hypothetical protein
MTMEPKRNLGLYLPADLIRQIEVERARIAQQTGAPISFNRTAEALLKRGLTQQAQQQ